MDRRILNVRVTQPVIDRLDSLARDIGYSRAELARWVLVTGCDEGHAQFQNEHLFRVHQNHDLSISSELGMRPLMERVLSRRDILKA